jgi:Mg-chelatase subunit ChlD
MSDTTDSTTIVADATAPAAAATPATGVALTADTASEYDFVVLVDTSGSMNAPSTRIPGSNRLEEVQETVFGLASTLSKYDSDGIDLIFFGGTITSLTNVTKDQVATSFTARECGGGTPLAAALQLVVDKQGTSQKNTVAIVFTDGAPDRQEPVEQLLVATANAQEKDEAISFLFVQVGNDTGATAFLTHLDNGLDDAKFDIVATISEAKAESMTALDLVNLAING